MKEAIAIGTISALALLAAAAPVRAQVTAMPAEPQADALGPPTPPPPKETLIATFFNQGSANALLPKQGAWLFNKGVSVTCTKGCTVEFDAMVQVGNNTATANQWEICGAVNHKLIPGCPFQGVLPSNKSFITGSYIGWTTLAKSTKAYLLQPSVYISAGPVAVASYAVSYRIYQP